jgi:hypothetical protein
MGANGRCWLVTGHLDGSMTTIRQRYISQSVARCEFTMRQNLEVQISIGKAAIKRKASLSNPTSAAVKQYLILFDCVFVFRRLRLIVVEKLVLSLAYRAILFRTPSAKFRCVNKGGKLTSSRCHVIKLLEYPTCCKVRSTSKNIPGKLHGFRLGSDFATMMQAIILCSSLEALRGCDLFGRG